MLPSLVFRILRTTDARCLWKFTWNFGIKGLDSVEKFKRRLKRGEFFPPFIYLSIINSCNLRCQGCWVDVDAPRESISLESFNRLVNDAKRHGNCFFGILGGEPTMHPELLDMLAAHPGCYFHLFTNGQFITREMAIEFRRLGNVSPLISIEGKELVSDERRGKKDVFSKTLRGLENCLEQRLFTGVATSVCQTNFEDLLSEDWLRELVRRKVQYVWFHSYRPVGPKMASHLALRPEQQRRMRQFIVDMRSRVPLGIVDAYYDHQGQALCPMATGISHHISPRGEIEPCPILQFASENISDHPSIYEALTRSAFLRDFREAAQTNTRGCIVLERPDLVKALVQKHGARDTTVRQTAIAELDAMEPRSSQYLPGLEIPESHWVYRVAKKYWFNDFGVYRNLRPGSQTKLDGAAASRDSVSKPLSG